MVNESGRNGSSSVGTTITAKCNDNSILTNNQSTAQHADTLLSGLLNMLTPGSVESFHKVLTPYLISSERAARCTGIWTKRSTAKSSDPLTHASFPQSNDALTNKRIVQSTEILTVKLLKRDRGKQTHTKNSGEEGSSHLMAMNFS